MSDTHTKALSTESSPFRTQAWVQAWIDTWGKDPRISLIDLGGRGHPLEQVYLTHTRIKKILPIKLLCLPGNGCGPLSTPRAEYNNLDSLIQMAGSVADLSRELRKLGWQQMRITDVESASALQEIQELASSMNRAIHTESVDISYSVKPVEFQTWLNHLGSNTRLAYYNRRQRLEQQGEITFVDYAWHEAPIFFKLLNEFHVARWGSPCYSPESQRFLQNFCERLTVEGGKAVMQAMRVNGETVSVLFDFIWQSRRYNLQSGYYENRYPKIALGALHFGYAIEAALQQGQAYDFMAGKGKNANYKERIANHQTTMTSLHLEIKPMSWLRSFTNMLKTEEVIAQ
jgi:hypothetical protein